MKDGKISFWQNWTRRQKRRRGRRALERQLEYQEKKADDLRGGERQTVVSIIQRGVALRQRLTKIKDIADDDAILEVGSGAHGLIFGFGARRGFGIDPLAVEYRRLFPIWQKNAPTVAAVGEKLPFADGAFDVVLSDNVIDHAEQPFLIVEEIVRVLKPGGLLYFAVNIHHPIYALASGAHGLWNGVGLRFELSPFADHTVHLTEKRMRDAFARLPLRIESESSTAAGLKIANRQAKAGSLENLLKKLFFKNAVYEIIAVKN